MHSAASTENKNQKSHLLSRVRLQAFALAGGFWIRDFFRQAFLADLKQPAAGTSGPSMTPGRVFMFGSMTIGLTAAAGGLAGSGSHLLIALPVFLGALVSGLAGFAFSAVTAALLTHWVAPIVFVPLLLACSITTQLYCIAKLWHSIEWRRCIPFVIGGIVGIPLGAALLRHSDPHRFGVGLGLFLVAYSVFMLLKSSLVIARGNRVADAACGVLGGITGGAIAFPGAAPTVWCALRGMPKDVQRGVVQPFILIMQVATLLYFSRLGILTAASIANYLLCVPAVLFGTWIGLGFFQRINDASFRRAVLIFLIVSGASLLF
jgi:uncharacterized protein